MTQAKFVYPNARQCEAMVLHDWSYYRRKGEPGIYYCNRCNYSIDKKAMKEATDSA